MSDGLVKDLKRATDASVVLDGLADRVQWACDASIYRLVPRVVTLPRHAEDVRTIMAIAATHRVPVTFRAGGTSLSGQAVGEGILIVVSRHMRAIRVLEQGNAVACQPGAVGSWVNGALARHSRRIGPDPASMQAAEIGGIVANNASGMCCGISQNSYRTVTSLDLILADGTHLVTGREDSERKLQSARPDIAAGIAAMRDEIRADAQLRQQIEKAFSTKNTVGYSLNAFLDADWPSDILQRLIVGSEGTLAFIGEATFRTLPLPKHRATAWLLFADVEAAGRAVAPLAELGAAAVELLDAVSLARVSSKLPEAMPPGSPAALLVEFQEAEADVLNFRLASATPVLAKFDLLSPASFTRDADLQARYWQIRKGLFPSVGAVRASGTAVVIEDITFPVAQLAAGVRSLRALFDQHGYGDAVIFGHAKDGNLHFTLTPDFSKPAEVERYDRFMRAMVDLVLGFGGNLKAEHGTGRNMAPFVEKQWGAKAVAYMRRIKQLLDPHYLLNPGVLLGDDSQAHIAHLKILPPVADTVDRCIECGFCEPVCPSRDFTMSPRQRIAALRTLTHGTRAERLAMRREWKERVVDSCAADGMCATNCPVSINTGELVKAERRARRGGFSRWLAKRAQNNFRLLTGTVRRSLIVASWFGGRLPGRSVRIPRAAPKLPRTWPQAAGGSPTYVYFPTCLARTFGSDPLPDLLNRLCSAAGIGLVIPAGATSLCCGQPFASKGFPDAYADMARKTAEAIIAASDNGRLPVLTDTSTCASQFLHYGQALDADMATAWKRMTLVAPAEFTTAVLIPRLREKGRLGSTDLSLAVHPTCSEQQHGWSSDLLASTKTIAREAHLPISVACCGMAGDKGWTLPELTEKATAREAAEVGESGCTAGVTTSATCAAALSAATGIDYRHVWHWLAQALQASGEQIHQLSAVAIRPPSR